MAARAGRAVVVVAIQAPCLAVVARPAAQTPAVVVVAGLAILAWLAALVL
jgi:hypothetical protein